MQSGDSFVDERFAAELDLDERVFPSVEVEDGVALQAGLVVIAFHVPVQRVHVDAKIAKDKGLEEESEAAHVVHEVSRSDPQGRSGDRGVDEVPCAGCANRTFCPQVGTPGR